MGLLPPDDAPLGIATVDAAGVCRVFRWQEP